MKMSAGENDIRMKNICVRMKLALRYFIKNTEKFNNLKWKLNTFCNDINFKNMWYSALFHKNEFGKKCYDYLKKK